MNKFKFCNIIIWLSAAFILLGATAGPVQAQSLNAREIMEKVDARDDGDNMTADTEMILIDKNDKQRIREIKVFSKDKGQDTLRMQFFLSPADVKGTAFLSYDYYDGARNDDQWLYLPELHKTKRISTSDKSSAFMGSDFSYADMTRRVLDEWKYRLLKEDKIKEHKVWVIEALPINKAVEDRYGYTKSVLFVRQDIFMGVRAVHWVKKGRRIKYQEMKNIKQIEGIWIATEIYVKTTKNKRTEHKTIMNWRNIKFNQKIDEDFFTVRQLEKGI